MNYIVHIWKKYKGFDMDLFNTWFKQTGTTKAIPIFSTTLLGYFTRRSNLFTRLFRWYNEGMF